MIAKPNPTMKNVSAGTVEGSNSGSCARKISIASAFTNPVITDLDTNRMR